MHGDETSTPNRVVLFVGGEARPAATAPADDDRADPLDVVGAGDVVVAADSGLHGALDAGVAVGHVVGDLDSVDPARLAAAVDRGATVHRHHADKDATDLELAVDLALDLLAPAVAAGGPAPAIHVIGGGGGRLDHLVGDLLLLSSSRLAVCTVTARFGPARLTVVRPDEAGVFDGPARTHVSLLPVHGDAIGVTTTGLRWPLVDGHLVAGTTRALSNELCGGPATVSVRSGTLAVLRPGTRGGQVPRRPGPYDPSPSAAPSPPPSPASAPAPPGSSSEPFRTPPPEESTP
jgi:thiamine pyrophosphokinase